ncbi:hypothetical protein BBJ28_00006482 [Nothophytophthora sp. Chile5]|nr:hypothetical protein BBJ28_00006482 [Nothophytophthora sp. Chile5]
MDERAEWALALRQVFQDVQLHAAEASGYQRHPQGAVHQRTLVPAVRRLNALFNDEVREGKRGVAEEAFALFLEELWIAIGRVLVTPKVSDVVVVAVASLVGEFLLRKSAKTKEPAGKDELRTELLKRFMDATKAEDRAVRLRACQMLQLILNRLEYIEYVKERSEDALLPRLNDKLATVRIQSVYALKKLQRPNEASDKVSRELQRLMPRVNLCVVLRCTCVRRDVRKAALVSLAVTEETYQDLLIRIRDSSEDVRYAAFRTLGNEMAMKDIPINDRAHLLDQGLQDRAARVRRSCEQMVLKKWFTECESSPVSLLKALDIEQFPEIGSKVSRLLLKHFSEQPRALLEKDGAVAFNALELLSANSDAFDAESVFFWKEQCHYYQKIDNDPEKAAALVPNVSDFTKLLATTCKAGSDVLFIAQQLFALGHLLDFQDEFGRRNLLDSLQKQLRELETDSQLITGIMELMAFVYSGSSEQEFIQVVAEIISDVYDPVEEGGTDNSSSQQQKLSEDELEEEPPTGMVTPQLHTSSAEEREAAELKFEELEKHLETLEFDSEEYNKVQGEMLDLERLLQDPRVLSWLRCLEIVAQLLKLTSSSLNNPILSGMARYILPAIDSDVPALREAGLENLGLFCLLDKRVAERYLVVFWLALNNPDEEREVKHTCVQAILDMAFSFSNLQPQILGAQKPESASADKEGGEGEEGQADMDEDKGDEEADEDEGEFTTAPTELDLDTIFVGLARLITVDDLDLQSTIVEGFCRLFMMNRIENTTVLAILLETYFSPKLQKVQLLSEHGYQSRSLQLLSVFFPAFVLATVANCMLLEEAAMHLIQKSMEKKDIESETMLDLGACAKYVMHLLSHAEQDDDASAQAMKPNPQLQQKKRRCAHHNRIGINICLEILALDKVGALPDIHQDVVAVRHKLLLKMITWTEITTRERRSAALFKFLLEEIVSTCFRSQRALLRSAEAFLKRTSTSFSVQTADAEDGQRASALEEDQTWAHDLVKEREDALRKVLLVASADHEKVLKKQERQKKAMRRRAPSSSSESADSESDDEDEEDEPEKAAAPPRREVSSRRSKTAAVDRMHKQEGEFDAKLKQALKEDESESDEEEDEEESESEEEESSAEEDE